MEKIHHGDNVVIKSSFRIFQDWHIFYRETTPTQHFCNGTGAFQGSMQITITKLPSGIQWRCYMFNSLALGWCGCHFKSVISENLLWIKFMNTSCKVDPSWMSQNTFHDESILVQVMTWCLTAPSHYLNRCWSISMSVYGITRQQLPTISGLTKCCHRYNVVCPWSSWTAMSDYELSLYCLYH